MIMAFTIDAKAALIFVVAIPLLSVIIFFIMLYTIPLYRRVQGQLDRVLGQTRQTLTGIRVVRAFCKEQEQTKEFVEENETLATMQKFVGRISALMNPICLLVVNGAIIALIWTGAIRVSVGLLTQGAVVALYNYMSQILVELIKLANLIINVTKAAASWRRIDAVFSIAPSVRSGEAVPKKAGNQKEKIVFRQAGLQYAGCRGGFPDGGRSQNQSRPDRRYHRRHWFRQDLPGQPDSQIL